MKAKAFEILLVEDNPYDAELALDALKKNNLANKVHWVEDGEQAIDYLYTTGEYSGRDVKRKPKLILLDLKLPKVDGMEVLQKIKSDEEMKTIPVVKCIILYQPAFAIQAIPKRSSWTGTVYKKLAKAGF